MKKTVKKNPPKLSLYAFGEGKKINAGGNVSVVRKKTTFSGNANIGPGYRSADIGVERRVNKNLTLGAQIGTGKSYGANVKLNIPIKSKKNGNKKR
jgi:acetylornithine deacetylase/succinyl-diaminopimelate desuccinylase-like protein